MSTTENDTPPVGSQQYENLAHTGSAPPIDVIDVPGRGEERRSSERDRGEPHGAALPGVDSGLGLRKFVDRLTQPPIIRAWRRFGEQPIRIRAEEAVVRLHAGLPRTRVWTYEGCMPAPTIEVRSGREVRIDWENGLADRRGPLHLPFDVVRVPPNAGVTDFVRALQPGGRSNARGGGDDAYPPLANTQDITAATVVHMHGALTDGHNDGWAHNVALPGNVTRCAYPNAQSARTLWYHDHAMAVTRFNVHAGLAGFYLIRDEVEDALDLPRSDEELVLAVADRNLETDEKGRFTGRILYKQAGTVQNGIEGEIPVTGPFTMVNGTIWPTKNVDARWHRLRLLNASNSRVMRFALHDTTDGHGQAPLPSNDPAFTATRIADALVVIGTDGGFLGKPSPPADGVLEMGPGERADVLVDFGALRGRTVELRNENNTVLNARPGQSEASAMQFVVDGRQVRDPFRLPRVLDARYARWTHRSDGVLEVDGGRLVDHHEHAWIGVVPPRVRGAAHPEMWELKEVEGDVPADTPDVIRIATQDGGVTTLRPVAKLFDDTVTLRFGEGDWAVWNIVHLGGPEHPMHIHMTDFQMLTRRQWPLTNGNVPGFDMTLGATPTPLPVPSAGRPIDAITAGRKDTWVVKPGEWVSILGELAGATGSFMYHCHILDHEDHTMMRPFVVLPKPLLAFHAGHGGGHH
ncbi:multicopper oxidase family protein [Dermacoccus abyssi]